MPRYQLAAGLLLRRGERVLEVRKILDGKTVVLEDQETGALSNTSVGKLSADVLNGRLALVHTTFVTPAANSPDRSSVDLVGSLDSLPERYRNELLRRRAYIGHLRRQGLSRGMRRDIKKCLAKLAVSLNSNDEKAGAGADPTDRELRKRLTLPVPSESTVMKWWREFELEADAPSALISGNVGRRRVRKLPDRVFAVISEKLKTHYCTRARPPLTETVIEINKRLAHMPCKADQYQVSEPTVRRALKEIEPFAVDAARYGRAYARNKWRYSLSGTGASRPLERVEIDHTLLDLVVVHDQTGMPLGRPTITVVVDAYSGYVLGFFISFWGTGLPATLSAIRQAVLPKDELTASFPELQRPWLAWGLHDLWVVDNGLEFHSPQFRLAALEMAADVLFCRVRQPWLKPVVERTMLDLKMSLPKSGLVVKGLTNELPLDASKSACVRFSDLCFGLLKAFVDVHPLEVNARRLARPLDLFGEGLASMPMPELPADLKSFDLLGCLSKLLTVGNEGVVMDYLRFNSKELQDIRRRTGATFRAMIKFQPGNLGAVYVQDPGTKHWLGVPSTCPEYSVGLSIIQHRAIRKSLKDGLQAKRATKQFLHAKAELNEIWAEAIKVGRKLKGLQLRAMQGLTSADVLGDAAPLSCPLPGDFLARAEDDEHTGTPLREIPSYESFQLE
ncbi:MAG: transposase [Chloroflexi bacterium]|nr:transposase [Chloroflexota bacterium]|tara:strand:+ start:22505 stop:24532 length:2028 start_codon:yes stop_codon:yes gene_type:complete